MSESWLPLFYSFQVQSATSEEARQEKIGIDRKNWHQCCVRIESDRPLEENGIARLDDQVIRKRAQGERESLGRIFVAHGPGIGFCLVRVYSSLAQAQQRFPELLSGCPTLSTGISPRALLRLGLVPAAEGPCGCGAGAREL